MYQEKIIKPTNGFIMLVLFLICLSLGIMGIIFQYYIIGSVITVLSFFILASMIVVQPNESAVLTFFGKYVGTVKSDGFYCVNPFTSKKKVSLRARNLNGQVIKVNDKNGNPIEIAAVVVWEVKETAKASFSVDDYQKFVQIQSEAAVRHLANSFSYDSFSEEENHNEITLKDGADQVNHMLENELNQRLERAGIQIIEARISHLAYAPEIASAMLQRQQASAIVAARKQIVEGAVGMVEMALDKLSKQAIVELDEEKKAAMVSNLLVVLCSDRAASPVVNAGTLHH